MSGEYLQNLRFKLQKRVRRLNSIDANNRFHFGLKQLWAFLHSNPVFFDILHELELSYPQLSGQIHKMLADKKALVFNTENEQAAASYILFGICNGSGDENLENAIGGFYTGDFKISENLDAFRSMFLEPLYDYLDEHIDDQQAILALLRRYKHKCEWFQREKLFKLWSENTQKGEKLLALDMYDFLHDQGLDFTIEPSSVSGSADLVAAQKTDDPLIADAKIFCPEKGKDVSYIAAGFNQVYIYTVDHNEPFGYLIVFKTCAEDIKFSLSNQTQSTPFVIHNNKTIFILVIDIFPHETSASMRGQLKSYEITEESLVKIIEDNKNIKSPQVS